MWIRTSCKMTFSVEIPTPFILMLRPRSNARQWVARESYLIQPSVTVTEFSDNYGNLCQRLIAPPGDFLIRTTADIQTVDNLAPAIGAPFEEVQNLPHAVLTYLLPSRYCESDRFINLALEIVADVAPGYDQVACITEWIRQNIAFNPDSIHFQMSAVDVNQRREGVCRELAHLGIALCRALCIPARMAVGYLHGLEPMDFHAWFEAYVGGTWHTFDPTQPDLRGARVTVAHGHDAADVAIFNQFGPGLSPTSMTVTVELLDEAPF
ncbi:MAG: transglutaminase family protein [Herminiimonas sp.]|nr:transglutaminase family protein [Herminiimonas sp.]